jgi:hypothetical protein
MRETVNDRGAVLAEINETTLRQGDYLPQCLVPEFGADLAAAGTHIEGLHLLASPTEPANNRGALVVDFREIYSLPFDDLVSRAPQFGPRWRLPYLEHFSQAFARFFMRVGLPCAYLRSDESQMYAVPFVLSGAATR